MNQRDGRSTTRMARRECGAIFCAFILAGSSFAAEVQPAKLQAIRGGPFTENMVLQRNRKVPIWGTGQAGQAVRITFQGQEWTGTVGPDGRWRIDIGPLKAHRKDVVTGDVLGYQVGSEKGELPNILVGDVWLCAGQSNMERPLDQEDYPVRVDGDTRDYPALRLNGRTCSGAFKAPALPYHFGRRLLTDGDVPIGLVVVAASGEWLPAFLSPERWNAFLKTTGASIDNEYIYHMYNQRASGRYPALHACAPMAVAGVFWDQGESNSDRFPTYYDVLLDQLYAQFSEGHEIPNLPFILVHKAGMTGAISEAGLPAWAYYDALNFGSGGYQIVGEGMRRWALRDPAHRVVVGNHDLRDKVHYWGKEFHGRRAATAALALTQGKPLPIRAPEIKDTVVEGNSIRVRFDFCGEGLRSARWAVDELIGENFAAEWAKLDKYELGKNGVVVKWVSRSSDTVGLKYSDWKAHVRVLDAQSLLAGFAIAGADAILYTAQARIDGDSVVVSNPAKVPAPKFVAYGLSVGGGWHDWNLYGGNGLPVLPFWTGPWPPGRIPGNAVVKQFQADDPGMTKETGTTLRWEVTGVETVTIEPAIGTVPAKGERKINPAVTTVYRLKIPVRWPAGESEMRGGRPTVKVGSQSVPQMVFKDWITTVVPSVRVTPIPPPQGVEPGVRVEYRQRSPDWRGDVLKSSVQSTPRILGEVSSLATSAEQQPVDIVFTGLLKVDTTGLCRLMVRNMGQQAVEGLSLQIGDRDIPLETDRKQMIGHCLMPEPGLYSFRLGVRAAGFMNLLMKWAPPGNVVKESYGWEDIQAADFCHPQTEKEP